MPQDTGNTNADKKDDATNTESFELDLGDGPKQFANAAELRTAYVDLHKSHADSGAISAENEQLKKTLALGKAAIETGSAEAERLYYKEIGLDDKTIAELFRNREGEGEGDEEEGGKTGGTESRRGGTTFSKEEMLGFVLENLPGKIGIEHFNPRMFSILEEMASRITEASSIVTETGKDKVTATIVSDPVISKYWKTLSDRQQTAALKIVFDKVGGNLTNGRNPTAQDVQKALSTTRAYLADAYGPVEALKRPGSSEVPTALALGGETTGYGDLTDDELVEEGVQLNSPDSKKGQGADGLFSRMQLAFERRTRNAKQQ